MSDYVGGYSDEWSERRDAQESIRLAAQAQMTIRRRNIQFEREITYHVAKGVADPTELIEHAEARAGGHLSREYVDDPMTIRLGADHVKEAREELPDARNRLVWWLEDNLDDPTVDRKQRALRHIILAYQELNA